MFFFEYVFLSPALLTGSLVFSLIHSVPLSTFTNDTVIEVIRNISRVNNALQKLIKNYEQLQKEYKTESFESDDDYSTDSEVDEQYRYEKHKMKSLAKGATEEPRFPATQFTAFDDTVGSGGTDHDSAEEIKSDDSTSDATSHNRLPMIENLYAQKSPSKNENKSNNTDSSVSSETADKEKVPIQTTSTKKPPQIVFIHTHKLLNNVSKSAHRNPQTSAQKIIQHEHDTSPKLNIRYKKVDHRSDLRSGFQNSISLSINVNSMPKTNASKETTLAESLPREKMWDEVSKNEPTKLQDDAYYRTKTNREYEAIGSIQKLEKSNLRNGLKDPELPSCNKSTRTRNKDIKHKESDYSSAAEKKALNKQIFKTHVLRKAYGDACSKLAVRKCFKACKMAVKRACVSSGCKSSFKESFKLHSRTGCIKEFDHSQSQPQAERRLQTLTTGVTDLPNDDHLTAACWPVLSTNKLTTPKSNQNLTSLNILRDRYEKACQFASALTCRKVCMESFEAACKIRMCPRKRESRFKWHCQRECRLGFKKRESSSSSDSSYSDSSDSSDSDSSDSSDSDSSDSDSDSS